MNLPVVLSHVQTEQIMKRFPTFELSYETVSHKKVLSVYNICMAIPQGRKCFVWFTFLGEEDVCFLFDLNREKKIVKVSRINVQFKQPLAMGTVLYGAVLDEDQPFFVIEDIFYCKGIQLKNCNVYQKLEFKKDVVEMIHREKSSLHFALPVFWDIQEASDFEPSAVLPNTIINNIGYPVHHIQYRSLYETVPYINVQTNRPKIGSNSASQMIKKLVVSPCSEVICDFSKTQYNFPTVFEVCADIQFDIYHLYAYGLDGKSQYYGIAGIPNYQCSVFMNSLFRKIRENKNLDYIEESDDEDDFQNNAADKYVDLEKKYHMEFTFHKKFKKWIPLRVVDSRTKLVFIGKLTRDNNHREPGAWQGRGQGNGQGQRHQRNGYYSNDRNNTNRPNYHKKIYA